MRIVLSIILMLLPFGLCAQEEAYCQLGGDKGPLEPGFDSRFCFGSKEYMEAFAKELKEAKIPHHLYANGDIGTRSQDRNQVQIIGDSLLCELVFKNKGCE